MPAASILLKSKWTPLALLFVYNDTNHTTFFPLYIGTLKCSGDFIGGQESRYHDACLGVLKTTIKVIYLFFLQSRKLELPDSTNVRPYADIIITCQTRAGACRETRGLEIGNPLFRNVTTGVRD